MYRMFSLEDLKGGHHTGDPDVDGDGISADLKEIGLAQDGDQRQGLYTHKCGKFVRRLSAFLGVTCVMCTGYTDSIFIRCRQRDLLEQCVRFAYLPPSGLVRHFLCAAGGLFPETRHATQ